MSNAQVIQEVSTTGAGNTGAAASIALTITTSAGSSLHIIGSHGSTATTNMAATPLVNTGTAITFSAALDNIDSPVDNQRLVHYKADNVPAQTTTITMQFSNASATFRELKIREVINTSGYDAAASAHAAQLQSTPTTGTDAVTSGNTPTLTSQPALISAVTVSTASATTNAVGTGFTNDQVNAWQFGNGVNMSASESKRVTSTAAVAGTFTAAANDSRITVVAVFLESVAAAPVDPRGSDVTSRNRPGRGPRSKGRYEISTRCDAFDIVVPAAPTVQVDTVGDRTGTRDNRPGRGPYSLGQYFRPRTEVTASLTSHAYSLACDFGNYALTGQAVGLPVGRVLAAAQGSYALTGQTVALARGRVLAAAQGAYVLSGQTVGLTRGRVLAAGQGSYAITGQTVGLARGRVLAAAQGAYTLTGQTVGLTRGRVLAAAQGSYALTGQTVLLTRGRVLGASQGSYALSGQAVTLTPSGSHAFTITAVQGSYALTGQSIGMSLGRKLAAAQGSYALTGQAIAERVAHALVAAQGSYALTGMAVVLSIARRMAAAQGAYVLSGQPIAERVTRTLVAAPGSYALAGQTVGLSVTHANSRVLVCAPGAYVISGKPIVLTVRRRMNLGLGLYVLTGQPASLVFTASIFSGHQPLFHTRPEFLAMDRVVLQFFGEPTQYFAGSGVPTQPRGVFFDPYTDVDVGTAEVQSVSPFVWYLLADLPADPQETPPVAIIIRGKSYKPKEPQKDSDGGVKIELHLST